MNTRTAIAPVSMTPRPLRIFALELRNELLKLARMPAYALPAIGFPWMFYVLFGLVLPGGKPGSETTAAYLLATYGVFGVLGVAMFSLGAAMAIERGQGWATVRRAMPSAPILHLGARLAVAAIFGTLVMLGLMVLGASFGGVRLPTATWALLLVVIAACSLPFGAVGMALGQLLGPNSAVGVINAVFLPMSFLSGLWIPIHMLPKVLQTIAPMWPSYHAAQLALQVVGGKVGGTVREPAAVAIAVLALITVAAFAVAIALSRRAAARTWG